MAIKRLFVNGKRAVISKIENSRNGFNHVYVDDFSSRHTMPTEFLAHPRFSGKKCITGGNTYEWRVEQWQDTILKYG